VIENKIRQQIIHRLNEAETHFWPLDESVTFKACRRLMLVEHPALQMHKYEM